MFLALCHLRPASSCRLYRRVARMPPQFLQSSIVGTGSVLSTVICLVSSSLSSPPLVSASLASQTLSTPYRPTQLWPTTRFVPAATSSSLRHGPRSDAESHLPESVSIGLPSPPQQLLIPLFPGFAAPGTFLSSGRGRHLPFVVGIHACHDELPTSPRFRFDSVSVANLTHTCTAWWFSLVILR